MNARLKEMSKGVTIYFMRHGQTYLNHYHRIQGWADAPLTEKGKRDAQRSAIGLRDVNFSAVYTSDLQRTVATAEIILKYNYHAGSNLPINKRKAFREQFFGSFEGLEVERIWGKVSDYIENEKQDLLTTNDRVKVEMDTFHELDPTHDAEDFMTFWLRVELGLIDVITAHRETDQNILIVSHGMTIRNMIHELIPEFSLGEPLDNASVSIVRYQDGFYHLEAYNQTDHFALEEKIDDVNKDRERKE